MRSLLISTKLWLSSWTPEAEVYKRAVNMWKEKIDRLQEDVKQLQKQANYASFIP